jgi:hypothetical protein
MNMNRTEVLQQVINQRSARNYLEIGVNNGVNFFKIRAASKIGVDPNFCYTQRRKINWYLRNPTNWRANYYEITSDQYFKEKGAERPIDVAFIDGLHTHEQSLKDVLNAVDRLSSNGVIIMHDCNPPSQVAATPADSLERAREMKIPGISDAWCGDVWKTVCYLRSQRKDLSVFVLDCDFGLGVVTKAPAESMLDLSLEGLSALTFDAMHQNKQYYLNLKNENYLFEFLNHK